jgi:hypothetical protein
MWIKIAVTVFALLLVGLGGTLVLGTHRWCTMTRGFVSRLNASRQTLQPATYTVAEIESLPAPVARYFRTVLRDGQLIVAGTYLVQTGEFRMGEAEESWRPFGATQVFRSRPAGFVWDARIRLALGLCVHVRDAYVNGAESMRGELLGLVRLVDAHDTPELTAGALQRYLTEAVWFPTALLPSQGVQWTRIDDSTARATLTDGGTTVSLEFGFSQDGLITSAFTPSRYREVHGAYQPTPWLCRYADYAVHDGMRIPLAGAVEWQLPDRPLPYWRGRITAVTYEYAR